MDNYMDWDGSENGLYNLLIWWVKQIPWEHSSDCDGIPLHCCEGVYKYESNFSLEGSDCATYHGDSRSCLKVTFVDDNGKRYPMKVGDRIYYRGEGKFELVRNG